MNIPFDVTGRAIETKRLLLRAFVESDLEDFYAYASVPGVGEMAGWPHHESIETSKSILQMFLNEKNVFAIFHNGDQKVIGSLGLHESWTSKDDKYKHLKAKEIGYVIAKDYWGQGLASEVAKSVIAYGFDTLGLEAYGICHFKENVQSRRVIEKCGFTFVKQDVFHAKQMQKQFDDLKYILLRSA